jgi:alkanesulfonate monooxygenase
VKFGLWIPAYCHPGLSYDDVRRQVRDYSERCGEHDFDIWVIDHLLVATGLYGVTWLEPLKTLTYASALAPDVRVGTGILVMPLRHPVLLAKEIATLDYLTGGKFILGVGPGWYPPEFEALGNTVRERGRRTDELIDAVRLLLTEDDVTFEGKYYSFENVTIGPRPPAMPEIWVAGGSRVEDPEFNDHPVLADTVLDRILAGDAWLSRCSGNQEWVKRDWETIQGALVERGRPADSLTFAHTNFTHLVDTTNREQAIAEQRRHFATVMGTHRSFEHLEECYLFGTIDEIVERLKDLEKSGLEYLLLGTTSDDPAQVDMVARHIAPNFQ